MKQVIFSTLIIASLAFNLSATSDEAQIYAQVTRSELTKIDSKSELARVIVNGTAGVVAIIANLFAYKLTTYGFNHGKSAIEQAALSQPYLGLAIRSGLAFGASCWLIYRTAKMLINSNKVIDSIAETYEKDRIKLLEEQFENALSTGKQKPTVTLDENGLEICEIK